MNDRFWENLEIIVMEKDCHGLTLLDRCLRANTSTLVSLSASTKPFATTNLIVSCHKANGWRK